MKMKAKSVLSSVIALGLAFGAVSAQADDRHGFDAEGAMAKHGIERGISGSENDSMAEYLENLRSSSSERRDALSGAANAAIENRSGQAFDSSGNEITSDTAAWWGQMEDGCESDGGVWNANTQTCLNPQLSCAQMGFRWRNGTCEIEGENLAASVQDAIVAPSGGSIVRTGVSYDTWGFSCPSGSRVWVVDERATFNGHRTSYACVQNVNHSDPWGWFGN